MCCWTLSSGAVRISAGVEIVVTGWIRADGGDGGRGCPPRGGNGGGGSGGSILLQARSKITLAGGGLTARGGKGGNSSGEAEPGGDGGAGRIRLEAPQISISGLGEISPDPSLSTED